MRQLHCLWGPQRHHILRQMTWASVSQHYLETQGEAMPQAGDSTSTAMTQTEMTPPDLTHLLPAVRRCRV